MGVVHVVLFKWKADASREAIETAIQALRALKDKIPGIAYLSCGENFSERAKGFHCALVVRFVDRAALEVYQPHPAHQYVVQNLLAPIREDIIVVDYPA